MSLNTVGKSEEQAYVKEDSTENVSSSKQVQVARREPREVSSNNGRREECQILETVLLGGFSSDVTLNDLMIPSAD